MSGVQKKKKGEMQGLPVNKIKNKPSKSEVDDVYPLPINSD
jgi:hypothetical protein